MRPLYPTDSYLNTLDWAYLYLSTLSSCEQVDSARQVGSSRRVESEGGKARAEFDQYDIITDWHLTLPYILSAL